MRIGQRGATPIIQRRGNHGIANAVKLRFAHAGRKRTKAAAIKLAINRSPRIEQSDKFGNRIAAAFDNSVDLAQALPIGEGGLSLPGDAASEARGPG